MPKHEIRNIFDWIMKFGQFMSHYKRKKIIKEFCKNGDPKTSSWSFCVCKELSSVSIGKWSFWSKVLTFVEISMLTFPDFYLQRKRWKLTSFQATFFMGFFNKIFSLVMLHKLAKFRYQPVFTSQVSYSQKCISRVMARHFMTS